MGAWTKIPNNDISHDLSIKQLPTLLQLEEFTDNSWKQNQRTPPTARYRCTRTPSRKQTYTHTHTPARKVSCTKAVILLCGPDVKSFNAKADDEPSQRPNQSATGRRGQEQFVSVRWCWWAKVIVGNINTKSVYDMKNVDSNCRIATLQGAGSARARVIAKESMPPAHTHIESERGRQADTQAHIRFHIVACLIALGARFCCSFYRCCWLWWKIWLCPLCECLAVKIIITHTTPDTRTHTHTHTTHTDCRLVGSHIWRALFSATFFMTLFLTLLARLASSVLP